MVNITGYRKKAQPTSIIIKHLVASRAHLLVFFIVYIVNSNYLDSLTMSNKYIFKKLFFIIGQFLPDEFLFSH